MGAKDQGADAATTRGRWHVIPRTLCFVTHGDDILLLKRAAHKRIFPNHYNGLGGHIERGEDPLSGAVREIYEESGLTVHDVEFCGNTHVDVGHEVGIMLFVFKAVADQRTVTNNDEGTLHWLPLQHVLQDESLPLVEDLPIILSRIFEAQETPFFARVSYDDDDQIQVLFA